MKFYKQTTKNYNHLFIYNFISKNFILKGNRKDTKDVY